jgi:arylsulfatase A-like enzyme
VVFIVSDDHHPDVVGAYGNPLIQTPNIDRLASGGIKFTNAYANSPICSASRQSMMTGKYPHATGVSMLFTPFPQQGNVTIAQFLKEKGYTTAIAGKTHFSNFVFSEHKRFEKHTFWRESITAPLIIQGKLKYNAGRESDALAEFVDLVPTVADALGFEQHADFQGKSFLNLLQGNKKEHREEVFAEYLQDDMAMLANKEFRYVFMAGKYDLDIGYETGFGPSGIFQMLYNIKSDPKETTNLAYKPEYAQQLSDMQNRLLDKFSATHPDAAKVPDELTDIGKLVWFCQPRDIGANYQEKPLKFFISDENQMKTK